MTLKAPRFTRTKIVATLGPASYDPKIIEQLVRSGVGVIRLNFSHAKTPQEYLGVIKNVRRVAKALRAPVAIMQDLQGPKIRVGVLAKPLPLRVGQKLVLGAVRAAPKLPPGTFWVPMDFAPLVKLCQEGTKILLDDGHIELRVQSLVPRLGYVHARVLRGGVLKSRKGVNLPGTPLPLSAMTTKDLKDLKFGLEQGVDYVALSFVRRPQDVLALKNRLKRSGSGARIVSKIEMLEALENLDSIIELSDAIMVARGDLAIETGAAQLPAVQKKIISRCNALNTPVITATQMLESMTQHTHPTRAEITDIANAILDGTDALMLSAETAMGKHPLACVKTMHDICLEVERHPKGLYHDISLTGGGLISDQSIACAATLCAMNLDAPAIVCLSTSGRTAILISANRPRAHLVAVTDREQTFNQLSLMWGIRSFLIPKYKTYGEALKHTQKLLREHKLARAKDPVVLTYGLPKKGVPTNTLQVRTLLEC